jgi:hypothetical protein
MPDGYEAFLRRKIHLLLIKMKGREYDPYTSEVSNVDRLRWSAPESSKERFTYDMTKASPFGCIHRR